MEAIGVSILASEGTGTQPDRPCLHAKGWCDGPDRADLDAATLGVCADCLAVATAGGDR